MNERERFATALFCDEVRSEMGGRRSFMGVFTGDLVVPFFPVAIDRMAVVVNLQSSLDVPMDPRAVVITLPAGEEIRIDVVIQPIPAHVLEGARRKFLAIEIALRQLMLTEAGRIRAEVNLADDSIVYAGSLRVRQANDQEQAEFAQLSAVAPVG
jgi:hypothetical protein